MTFSRINPPGWALYEVLTSPQMNQLDIDHARAIDGYAGGTYTPSAPILINGKIEITAPTGFVCLEVNAASGESGIWVNGKGIGTAIYAESEDGQNADAVKGIGKGTGAGVHGTNSSANGFGVKGAVSAAGAIGVHGISTSEIGVKGEGDTIGVEGIGGSGIGVQGTGGDAGTDSHGVKGIGGSAGGAGVYAEPGYTSGYGVYSKSISSATSIYAQSTSSGTALVIDAAAGTGSPMVLAPVTANPVSVYEGSMWFYSNGGTNELRCYLGGSVRTIASF